MGQGRDGGAALLLLLNLMLLLNLLLLLHFRAP